MKTKNNIAVVMMGIVIWAVSFFCTSTVLASEVIVLKHADY